MRKQRTNLAAASALIVVALNVTAGAQGETYEGTNWEEALAKVPCDHIHRGEKGIVTIDGVMAVGGQRDQSPTISDAERISMVDKHCPSGTRRSLTGVGR
jgi:hypothetical protein